MSISVTAGFAVASYLINALAPLANALEPLRQVSPFYYYSSGDPLSNGLNPVHLGILTGLMALFLAMAAPGHWGLSRPRG